MITDNQTRDPRVLFLNMATALLKQLIEEGSSAMKARELLDDAAQANVSTKSQELNLLANSMRSPTFQKDNYRKMLLIIGLQQLADAATFFGPHYTTPAGRRKDVFGQALAEVWGLLHRGHEILRASGSLVIPPGAMVRDVRPATAEEVEHLGFDNTEEATIIDIGGVLVTASQDGEGNGAGVFFCIAGEGKRVFSL